MIHALLPSVALSLALTAQDPTAVARPPADLIVEGRIFTATRDFGRAEALAIVGNRIAAVGTRAEIEAWRGDETRTIHARERSVVPGFNDAHGHFTVGHGIPSRLDLGAAKSLEEVLELVETYAAENLDEDVIQGGQWDLADMPGEAFPTAAMLDAVVADRPVLLWSEGPHGLWVNSIALERAGFDASTKPREGVEMLRDPETNEPTGVFLGRGLMFLFRFSSFPDMKELHRGIERGLQEARRLGVTTVQESVSPFLMGHLAELHERGELTLRFHVWGNLGPFGGPAASRKAEKTHGRDEWITFGTLKGGMDGMPSLRTARMLEPYSDDPGNRGLRFAPVDDVKEQVLETAADGLRVALHATGDEGVRDALDAIEAASSEHPLRHRIEHAFLVSPEDVARFAELDVVASVQPSFLSIDLEKRRYYERRFGPERIAHTLPLRSLLDAGAVLAFGTDFSLTPLDPMVGLHAAVTRRDRAGEPAEGWVPEQRITLEEAVRAYTFGSAYAEGAEEVKGTLEPGRLADLVILSEDIFAIDPSELLGVEVVATIVDGRVVYER